MAAEVDRVIELRARAAACALLLPAMLALSVSLVPSEAPAQSPTDRFGAPQQISLASGGSLPQTAPSVTATTKKTTSSVKTYNSKSTLPVRANTNPRRFIHIQKTMVNSSQFQRHYDDESVSMSPFSGNGAPLPGTPTSSTNAAPHTKSAYSKQLNNNNSVLSSHVTPKKNGMSARPMRGPWVPNSTTVDPPSSSGIARARAAIQPLLESGRYADAQKLITEYIRSHPRCNCFRQELARIAVANSQQQLESSAAAAASTAREAIAADPTSQSGRDALGQALVKMGIDPGSAQARMQLGDQLLAQGKNTEAAVEYSESGRLKPSAEAHVGVGNAVWRERRKDIAKLEYQEALNINPKSSDALKHMGMMLYQEGDVVGASRDLSKALILNPTDQEASKNLIDLWQSEVSRHPGVANSHLGLARAYQLSGNLGLAQGEYSQVVKLDPANPKLPQARRSFKAAMLKQQQGQFAPVSIGSTPAPQFSSFAPGSAPAPQFSSFAPGSAPAPQFSSFAPGSAPAPQFSSFAPGSAPAPQFSSFAPGSAPAPQFSSFAPGSAPAPQFSSFAPGSAPAPQFSSFAPGSAPAPQVPSFAPPLSGGSPVVPPTSPVPGMLGQGSESSIPLIIPVSGQSGVVPTYSSAAPVPGASAPVVDSGTNPGLLPAMTYLVPGTAGGAPMANAMANYNSTGGSQVQTMSSFISQIKSIADAAAQGGVNAGAGMAASSGGGDLGFLGGLAGLAGGSYAAQAAASSGGQLLGSPVLSTSIAPPPLDTSAGNGALSQATAALQAAGASPTIPSSGSPLPGGPATFGADGGTFGGATAMSFPAAGAMSSSSTQIWIAWAIQVLGGDTSNPKVIQMARQFGPMAQQQAATSSPQEMNRMYHKYRSYLQKRLGTQLPQNLPPLPTTATGSVGGPTSSLPTSLHTTDALAYLSSSVAVSII